MRLETQMPLIIALSNLSNIRMNQSVKSNILSFILKQSENFLLFFYTVKTPYILDTKKD